ncbi:PAS domain S-box protein [Pelagibacterium xiamenense]|uniref:PAS domain S-box protein n=1 Tax=Pelagibacterium xiamenense TaxID=2901140 RepID=UPI001E4361DF|nr:PAS domain S-box protein [Pelagibacterium xiamenense]MCD7060756.1 PAS domain S-box protein [Pelagibacterium xiamenense]
MADSLQTDPSLAGQAAKLRAILDSAVDAIITIDRNGTIMTVNPAAERLFGYARDEFIGRNVHFLMPEPYHSEHDGYIRAYRETGRKKIIGIGREVVGRRADGTTFPIHLAVSEFEVEGRTQFAGIIRDLSEHKATERALREAQKMDAMGQLTGGIAHDFNNLLTVIIGNLEMLDARLTTDDKRQLASEALEAAEIGARLTSRLLAFARRSHLEPEPVNLNTFVLGLTDMLHRTLGETVFLSNALSPSLWMVRTDASQVESAIVNLAVNARDAMPSGGRLVIETSNIQVDEEDGASESGIEPGDYVRLSVSDTGLGMPAAVRERAFEPFFTTKEKGKGTGLGLSMIYGFAKQSGGHATIYSEPEKGTTVNLYLPRYREQGEAVAAGEHPEATRGHGELVLAVEDDDRVRRLTVTRLKELGYTVLDAGSGPEALEILAANPGVDLLFSDLVMPGMSGYDLCTEARARYPGVRALLTSGYAEELTRPDALAQAQLKVLRKPYRMADLADAIASALREPPEA